MTGDVEFVAMHIIWGHLDPMRQVVNTEKGLFRDDMQPDR